MVRRALTVADADNVHVFQAVDMRTPSAVSKLARATSNLWAAGVKVQYWLFHQSQKALYSWINLPPYQFQQTSHWLEYIPPSVASLEPAQTIAKDEPLKLLHSMNRTPDGVTFGVNCTHDMFKLCTEGHAVLGQSLCPASMYVEMAVQAVTQLSGGSVSGAAPSVRDLKISSPLSISTNRRVSLGLVPVNREQDTWEYAVISRGQQNAAHPITHATGIISLNLSKISFESSRMQSFQRLVGQARYEYLSKVPDSNTLTRKIVYQVFGQVVDYAPYFRGVEQIVSNDNEAVGTVSVPRDQPSIMKEATCDPITLDNFLQVAGIHVNCLSERNEDELYVCTELGELFLSERFLATRREMDSWSVYSTFERSSSKRLINDIFVWNSKTGDLLVMFLGAVFQGVPKKLLAKTLATLNSNPNLTGSQNGQSAAQIKSMRMETNKLTQGVDIDTLVKTNGVTSSRNGVQSNRADMLQKVRELLSSVIDIPIDDVQPSATLAGLGIDSLMSTEVLNELKTRFDVAIQAADFLRMNDVQSLAEHLTTSAVVDESQIQVPHPKQAQSNGHENGNVSPIQQVQKLFGGLLGISDSEIVADALLSDLGVDSLMATEVLNEITKRFDVTITADELQDLQDIRSLANRLQELSSASNPPHPQRNGHSNHHLNGHVNGQRLGKASQAAESFTSIAHGSFTKIQRNFDKISTKTSFTDFYRYVYPSQMQLVVAYVVEAFRAMGSSLETLSAGESVNDITVLSKHHKVKNQIYRILEDQNIIQRDSTGKSVRTSVSLPQGPSERLHQEIVANFPQHAFEHNLLASTGSKLADCLTGRADPLAILFGSANARTLMENVYTHAPMFKNGTINLAQYLVDLFNNFTDETRPIHILELGAGTGGTTKHLIECLAATHRKFQYTFTDLSSSLVAAARKKFSHHDFMRYAVLNIEEEPPVQLQGQYDIVISANCIHATKNLTRSCTNINKLLQPNGILCLVELTRNLFWFDLVFGLLEGWWLFEDGRQHALANENLWKKHLSMSNFRWIDWTVGRSDESSILRLITASPSNPTPVITTETVEFKRASDQSLQADIYYPQRVLDGQTMLPIALMIHGGGHIMLSRKDIRPPQTKILLDAGFLPVSVDYRLCPEMTLPEGPMQDVCDALSWARTTLPTLPLQRHDVRVDGDHVVAVGWSTGGHLALTLGFTAPQAGIRPPDATLAFYCPLDYEDPFWSRPNKPFSQDTEGKLQYDLLEGVYERPITAYNPSPAHRALGGWMAPNDPRSRIALHMNWKGRTLRVLLNKLSPDSGSSSDPTDDLPEPTLDRIQSVSPLAQIQKGAYRVPTFIIHGTKDDLIPWQQAMRTYEALRQKDVIAEVRILEGAAHLFDLYQSYKTDEKAIRVVQEGYEFLRRHVIR
ncbi:hypothetical protein CNMCM5623_005000 [Aspergillus felis]|uniref:S-adenosyl-L-methionine-dependent N-methyltransferase n=1 Tax=Aspergillus felis TaxID=1287682 RepID=A0A8H6UQG2_9EURO|nr:hypothetical protein CNMCM5623_005000 [Aspergillus felis]